jgi:hypothetical protein
MRVTDKEEDKVKTAIEGTIKLLIIILVVGIILGIGIFLIINIQKPDLDQAWCTEGHKIYFNCHSTYFHLGRGYKSVELCGECNYSRGIVSTMGGCPCGMDAYWGEKVYIE